MSRGGAERRRAGTEAGPTASSRVTAPAARGTARRPVNWLFVVVICLVLLGLVGGFFIALVRGNDASTSNTTVATAPAP